MGFWDTNRSSNPNQKTRPSDNLLKKKSLGLFIDFDVPTDHRGKIKEREKRERNWKREKLLGACQRTKRAVEPEGDGGTSCN